MSRKCYCEFRYFFASRSDIDFNIKVRLIMQHTYGLNKIDISTGQSN